MSGFDARDGVIVVGLGLLAAGLWLWFGLAVALSVLGALLLAAGVYGSVGRRS